MNLTAPLTPMRTFGTMSVHIGALLKEVKKQHRLTVEALRAAGLPYAQKSIFRHWKSKDLSTGVIRDYDKAFKALKVTDDIFQLLYLRERGIEEGTSASNASQLQEPAAEYKVDQKAATPPVQIVINLSPGAEGAVLEQLGQLITKQGHGDSEKKP